MKISVEESSHLLNGYSQDILQQEGKKKKRKRKHKILRWKFVSIGKYQEKDTLNQKEMILSDRIM